MGTLGVNTITAVEQPVIYLNGGKYQAYFNLARRSVLATPV